MNHDAHTEAMPITTDGEESERLARRLREAREYLGLSQEFVAEQLGIPRAAVSAIETAKRKVSSLELKQLARLYRRGYDYFLGEQELPEENDTVVSALYRATKKLSPTDKEQLLRFAQFLQQAKTGPQEPPDTAYTETE